MGYITPGGTIKDFSLPGHSSIIDFTSIGPRGTFWYADPLDNEILSLTPTGVLSEFVVPTERSSPTAIVEGPDETMWLFRILWQQDRAHHALEVKRRVGKVVSFFLLYQSPP